jgi:hypothetical protein
MTEIRKIQSDELGALTTLITSFMCDRSTNLKMYLQLVEIFERCYRSYSANNDESEDLRILIFEDHMRKGLWRGDILLKADIKTGLVTDGIHRGIAYLRCLAGGVEPEKLPAILLMYHHLY